MHKVYEMVLIHHGVQSCTFLHNMLDFLKWYFMWVVDK